MCLREYCLNEYGTLSLAESELVRRTVPLKLMFRSIHRLMQSGGTAEGLRNLIDSELPKSLLKTLQNANKLGAPVLAIGMWSHL